MNSFKSNAEGSRERGLEKRAPAIPGSEGMNEYHRRAVAVTFQHIDEQLAEIEAILGAIGAHSPFSAYALDIGPMAQNSVIAYLQRLREKMWLAVQDLEISPGGRRTSAAWAVRCAMVDVLINISELDPHRLGGYGPLPAEEAKSISGVCADLRRLSQGLMSYLARSCGEDLTERLARLNESPVGGDSLIKLETIITRYGLIELRPLLESIVTRLESPDLELAFFGRVNAGKSSLLNCLLGTDVLPVGVLPVTAVLTRLRRADEAEIVVRFETSEPQHLPLDRIAEFVTEERNPGNERKVAEVEARMPNPRLSDGVVFMDTPGVGSLATCGAAQTKAYLPRCDMGVLLVDAGSSFGNEDVTLLRGFFEAAIPTTVLLSKSDLLSASDRARVTDYMRRLVKIELGTEIPIYPVSSRPPETAMTELWFRDVVIPQMQRNREFFRQSIRRKTAHLGELAVSYLENMSTLTGRADAQENRGTGPQAEVLLAEARDRIAAAAESTTAPIEAGLSDAVSRIIHLAADEAAATARKRRFRSGLLVDATRLAMAETADAARRRLDALARSLGETLRNISADCGATDPLIREEALVGLTPLPKADEKLLDGIPPVRYPRMLFWWPAAAVRFIRSRMTRQAYGPAWSAIYDHRRKVRTWLKDNLDQICQAYESYAALFRDQLRRAGDGPRTIESAGQIQADLAFLRGMSPFSPGEGDGLSLKKVCENEGNGEGNGRP